MIGGIGAASHAAMTGRQDIEIHLFDHSELIDQVRNIAVRQVLERQPFDRNEIDREQDALARKPYDDAVVGMALADISQLDFAPPEMERHAV